MTSVLECFLEHHSSKGKEDKARVLADSFLSITETRRNGVCAPSLAL